MKGREKDERGGWDVFRKQQKAAELTSLTTQREKKHRVTWSHKTNYYKIQNWVLDEATFE